MAQMTFQARAVKRRPTRYRHFASYSILFLTIIYLAMENRKKTAEIKHYKVLQEFSNKQNLSTTASATVSATSSLDGVLPIATKSARDKSKKGFHPIYVYSNAFNSPTEKPPSKNFYSQARQDQVILALIDAVDAKLKTQNRKHYYVDLAANHAYKISNTYLLDLEGWDGLCIEANPEYWYLLAALRSCTVVGAIVGGTQEADGTEIDFNFDGVVGGIVGQEFDNNEDEMKEAHGEMGQVIDKNDQQSVKVEPTQSKRNLVSILTLFQQSNVPDFIDYLNLDVEGAESLVMNNFPFDQYKFRFLTVERPKRDLHESLKKHGYRRVQKLTRWGEVLWMHNSVPLTDEEINDPKGIIRANKLSCFHARCTPTILKD